MSKYWTFNKRSLHCIIPIRHSRNKSGNLLLFLLFLLTLLFYHFSREVTYSNFSDTVLPHKKLLCIAIPAGFKHVSCRYWDLGGCRCRRLQHEVLRERLRDTVYQNCDYRHATCLIPVGRASHRRIARGRRESYKPSERGIVVTNDKIHHKVSKYPSNHHPHWQTFKSPSPLAN